MTELGDSLERMTFMQLLLLFGVRHQLCAGARRHARACALRQRAALLALLLAVAFTALTDPWVHGALLMVFVIAGLGLFVMLSWLLARLLAPRELPVEAGTPSLRMPAPSQPDAADAATAPGRCARRSAEAGRVAPSRALSALAGAAQAPRCSKPTLKSLRPVRSRPRSSHSGRVAKATGTPERPSTGSRWRSNTDCPACSAAPRRRGAGWSGWPWRRGSCRRRASTSGPGCSCRSTAVASSKLSSAQALLQRQVVPVFVQVRVAGTRADANAGSRAGSRSRWSIRPAPPTPCSWPAGGSASSGRPGATASRGRRRPACRTHGSPTG